LVHRREASEYVSDVLLVAPGHDGVEDLVGRRGTAHEDAEEDDDGLAFLAAVGREGVEFVLRHADSQHPVDVH